MIHPANHRRDCLVAATFALHRASCGNARLVARLDKTRN
ncbi:hypothetical protein BSLA_03f0823 [Burkholderia stabilis]|nr:hypothetical protein BSLA_03f0823 [Burkholderia stabilis]